MNHELKIMNPNNAKDLPAILHLTPRAAAFPHVPELDNDLDLFKDPLNVIGLSQDDLEKLQAVDGDWVIITTTKATSKIIPKVSICRHASVQHTPGKDCLEGSSELPVCAAAKHKLAQVCTAQKWCKTCFKKAKKGCVLLSSVLWFNLTQQHFASDQGEPSNSSYKVVAEDMGPSTEPCLVSCPPFASEAHISLISSPQYDSKSAYDTELKSFFSTPRVLFVNDVFCIAVDEDNIYRGKPESASTWCPFVYFKVKKLLNPLSENVLSHLVDSDHTSLIQQGIVQSYIPITTQGHLSHESCTANLVQGLQQYIQQLMDIVQPYLSKRFRDDFPRENAHVIIIGQPGIGKTVIIKEVAKQCNLHLYKVNCYELHGETAAATEARIRNVLSAASSYGPCILLLSNIHALTKDREGSTDDVRLLSSLQEQLCSNDLATAAHPVVLIGTTSQQGRVAPQLFTMFMHELTILPPNESERADMLNGIFASTSDSHHDIAVSHIAQLTAGMVLGDLNAVVSLAYGIAADREQSNQSKNSSTLDSNVSVSINTEDLEAAVARLQAAHSDAIGAPKIPNVMWQDVGGLADVKAAILDTIQLPLQHPELFASNLRRSGVLLYGPPGTGKTLLAKAVATECSLNFLSVKGPELINMYVGQSEENVREVFSRARDAAPCVIFFDELDSLAPSRGRSGDSGGVMDRVVSQLLAELDGLHKSCDVFVIGATNRPDLLDPALLRPGRFDKMLYLGICSDHNSRIQIMKALTRKFVLSDDVDLAEFVQQCPENLTGADFYALCSDAMLNAITRRIAMLEQGLCSKDQVKVVVEQQDFDMALSMLVPSVSESELRRYQSLDI